MLICAKVPVSVTDAVPLPVTAAPPADATVSVPWATASVVVIVPGPASTSATDRPAIAVGTFAPICCVPGTVLTGAALIAVTFTSIATPCGVVLVNFNNVP